MFAGDLCEITSCSAPSFKEMQARGLLAPVRPARGRGRPADYDLVNAFAVQIILAMKNAHVSTRWYRGGLQALQRKLRRLDIQEWRTLSIALTSDSCNLINGCNLDLDKNTILVISGAENLERLKKGLARWVSKSDIQRDGDIDKLLNA